MDEYDSADACKITDFDNINAPTKQEPAQMTVLELTEQEKAKYAVLKTKNTKAICLH